MRCGEIAGICAADLRSLVSIALGCFVYAYGMNAVMIPVQLFSGGLTGMAVLVTYYFPGTGIGIIFFLLNLPLILLGWLFIGKRLSSSMTPRRSRGRGVFHCKPFES